MAAADSTFQTAIAVAVVLLVMGIVIAMLIVRVRNRRERRLNRNAPRPAPVYSSMVAKDYHNGSGSAGYTTNLYATTTGTTAVFPSSGSEIMASTSLMATGNTHHLFDSAPPIQNDPFAESSMGLTKLIDNAGNASHPVEGRGEIIIQVIMPRMDAPEKVDPTQPPSPDIINIILGTSHLPMLKTIWLATM
eukprot:maker-scaffold868_size86715-snap-gene-0.20 protein:Tk02334 transcript:maker-scaffold868_size86715-snap-gene-0.20-mRNA-1 annotation:"sugar isomerase KpsF/GutQ"